jgi:PAS domain S-box-containing protein
MRKRTVMVVEDEMIVAEDLTHWLTTLGYAVGPRAATGKEAVQRCEATSPDLVLMDIRLPGGMDGIQAAEIIRRRFDIPVVYITASSDDATLSRAKVTEPFGYILKPFDERSLYSTIEMALYKHMSERRIRDSEERFRLLYEYAPVAFQSLDADGHLLQVNKAWQELFGYTHDEVNGHWFGEFLTPESAERFIATFTRFRTSPVTESITLDVVTHSRRTLSVMLKGSIAVDQRGMFEMTQCVLEARMHPAGKTPGGAPGSTGDTPDSTFMLTIHGAWLSTSLEGVVLGVTPAVEHLLGFSADRICGRMISDLCMSVSDAGELLAQLTTTGTLDVRRLRLRHACGTPVETTVTGLLLRGQGGMPGSCSLYIKNV